MFSRTDTETADFANSEATLVGVTVEDGSIKMARSYGWFGEYVSSTTVADSDILCAEATWSAEIDAGPILVFLTNDGGDNWYQIESGIRFDFPTPGKNLAYKLHFYTEDSARTPILHDITVTYSLGMSA